MLHVTTQMFVNVCTVHIIPSNVSIIERLLKRDNLVQQLHTTALHTQYIHNMCEILGNIFFI